MAPAPTKAKPKCGIDTSMMNEMKARPSQTTAVICDAHVRSSSHMMIGGRYSRRKSGRPLVIPGQGIASSMAMVARTKQISSRDRFCSGVRAFLASTRPT